MPAKPVRIRKRLAIAAGALLLLVAVAAGAWYVASPWWTLRQMHEAAQAGDLSRFAAWVDTRTIDAEARRQHKSWWGSVLTSVRSDTENGRSFRALATERLAIPDSQIGIPPQEMMRWFAEMRLRFPGLDTRGDHLRPYIHRDGLDRFEVRYGDNDPDHSPLLTFRREGLGWRLDGILWGQQ